jgi:hypothetical protein
VSAADARSGTRAGDEVVVASRRLRGGERVGTILEVLGGPDREYYRVRWQDGHESVFHPGPDATVRGPGGRPRPARRPGRRPERAAPAVTAKPAPTEPPGPASPPPPPALRASAGDRLVVRGHHLGERGRDAEILETGAEGRPPFRVRWSDTGREGLLFPGPDALVEHFPRRRSRATRP